MSGSDIDRTVPVETDLVAGDTMPVAAGSDLPEREAAGRAATGRAPKGRSMVSRYARAFRTPRGIFAAVVIVGLTVLALAAPLLFPRGYDFQTGDSLAGLSPAHPFGTDELGRDLLARTIFGLRTDLSLIYTAVPVSVAAATILGLLGIVSPWLGSAVQRLLDIILGFPSLILGICIVLILGTGWVSLFVVIIIYGLPSTGRLARAALLTQQQREYVVAARTLGVGRWKILGRHILPNALDPIVVNASVFVVAAVFIEAALSIVGLGIQPPNPSLGALLNVGMRYINQSPTCVVGPILVLLLLALAFSVLADALNETVNRT